MPEGGSRFNPQVESHFNLRLEGYEEYIQKLRRAPRVLSKHMRRALQQIGVRTKTALEQAPSPPAGSRYVRTGELESRWSLRVHSGVGTVRSIIENPKEYAPWVQSDRFQARVHRGRWPTPGGVLKANQRQIKAIFDKELEAAVKEIDQ